MLLAARWGCLRAALGAACGLPSGGASADPADNLVRSVLVPRVDVQASEQGRRGRSPGSDRGVWHSMNVLLMGRPLITPRRPRRPRHCNAGAKTFH